MSIPISQAITNAILDADDFGFRNEQEQANFISIIYTLMSKGMTPHWASRGGLTLKGTDGRHWWVINYDGDVELEHIVDDDNTTWRVFMWLDRNGNVDGHVSHIID